MKFLFDVGHPAHVHYFKNLIKLLKKNGNQVLIVAREKDVTHRLLRNYRIPYLSRGKGSKTLFISYQNKELSCRPYKPEKMINKIILIKFLLLTKHLPNLFYHQLIVPQPIYPENCSILLSALH